MKTLVLLFILLASCCCNAQVFTEPKEEYLLLQVEIDPLGSIDKEGINSVISVLGKPKHLPIEAGIGIQTIFTSKYVNKYEIEQDQPSVKLDYLDVQMQAQYLISIGDRVQLLAGIHGGYLYRQYGGGMIGGIIGTSRVWVFKHQKWAITMSGAYDRRQDINAWKFNGRGGISRVF